jgi:RND superfamily putative drug exporter
MSEIAKTAPGARLQWTGDSAIKEAIINSSNQDLRRSELRAMPLTVVMLLIAFGSLTAALIPVVIGFLAIVLTLAACFALTGFIDLSVMVQSVATLLGLALGIDYSLLMINRYRELRARHHSRQRAVLLAMRTDGRTIAISGTAVAIGFAGLTLVPVDQMRSIAFAGLLVALFAVLLATTLVPALLVCFGRKINFGQLRLSRYNRSSDTRWRRWAALVCRHPFRVMLLSSLPLLLLAISSPRMSSSFPEESWLPARTEAVQALRVVEQLDNGNVIKQLKVLYDLPDSIRVTDGEGLRALRRLHIHLKRDERAARVRSLISFPGSSLTSRALIGSLPDEVLGHYAGRDQSSTLIEVVPKSELDQLQLAVLVEELRSMDVSSVTGLGGRVRVGGLPASAVDYERSIAAWFPLVVMAVLIGSGLSLSVAFRSVLVPVKAVLLNLLAVFAAYGAVVLVFVDGFGVAILGLDSAIQGVFPATPALVFCAAFGISMDYEVFLIARIAEARRSGMDESGAIIEGVARTGPMITSAAAIMIIVFGAFVFGEVLPTQILGFALAAVVMLDALLIRVALGPAMMRIAGRYNWWPGA